MINLLIIFLVKVFYMVGTPLSPSIKELGDGLSQNCSSRWNSTCFSGDGSGVRLMRGWGGGGGGRSIFKMKDSRFCQSIFCYVSSFYFLMEHINKTTQKLEII